MERITSLNRIAKILGITYATAFRWANNTRHKDGATKAGGGKGLADLVSFLTSLSDYELIQIFGQEAVEKSYEN